MNEIKKINTKHTITVLLIDDQTIIGEAVRRMLSSENDIEFHFCNKPTEAIKTAEEINPTVILQDLVMPDVDGLMLVKFFRANQFTKDIPLIVLSSKEEPKTKAEAFALGANDYLVKLPDKIELIARIRYHSKAYINLLQRNEAYDALFKSQEHLAEELNEAADYVRSLLPIPINGKYKTSWIFIPSTQLGGDCFGYHWLDEENFAIYLLDVCGHGVGAALLSISAMNVLRTQSLPHTNFYKPSEVLNALNNAFKMDEHNNKFFTMWYGIYNSKTKVLNYGSAGHPPAILLTGKDINNFNVEKLRTPAIAIGSYPDFPFKEASITLNEFNKIFLFSDGVYEIVKDNDKEMLSLDDFVGIVKVICLEDNKLENLVSYLKDLQKNNTFEDDFSILEVIINN